MGGYVAARVLKHGGGRRARVGYFFRKGTSIDVNGVQKRRVLTMGRYVLKQTAEKGQQKSGTFFLAMGGYPPIASPGKSRGDTTGCHGPV